MNKLEGEPNNRQIQDYNKMPKKQKKLLIIVFSISIVFLGFIQYLKINL